MAKKVTTRTPTVGDVVSAMHELAPPALAESWDNVGLQLGDPAEPVRRGLVALEVTSAVLREAEKRRANLLVTHHPLIFRPLGNLVETGTIPRLATRMVRSGIALLAAHTNLDSVAWGTNGELADRMGLMAASRGFLRPSPDPTSEVKIAVFVPVSHIDAMIEAVHRAGAGIIGDYSHCTFRTPGTGTYRPLEGANPWQGKTGKLEHADEVRLETVCPAHRIRPVIEVLRAAHPYEEMAYDIYPLVNGDAPRHGLGLTGELPKAATVESIGRKLKKSLGGGTVRYVGKGSAKVRKVAICTGAGGEFIRSWRPGTADLFVTGELSHHDCHEAMELGLPVLLVGHWASEAIVSPRVAETLTLVLGEKGYSGFELTASRAERDPLKAI